MAIMKRYDFYLLRGWVREAGHWGSFIDQLSDQSYVNSVQGIDLPGNGQFHRLSSPLSVKSMAHFVHSHISKDGEAPKALLAVSLGAMVALEVLAQYGPFYQAAFLMNTSIAGLSPFYERLKPSSLKSLYEVIISPSLEEREMNILELVSNSPSSRNEIHPLWVNLAKQRPVSQSNALKQLLAASSYRLPREKPQCPIYLMASTADRMVDFSCTKKLSSKWGLPMTLHPKAGHELSLDDPQWVLQQIKSWLQTKSD